MNNIFRQLIPKSLASRLTITLALITAIQVVLFGTMIHIGLDRILIEQHGSRALAVSIAVSNIPEISQILESGIDSDGRIQKLAEKIRVSTNAEFVVVGDKREIRYSHPNPDNIGKKMVGGDNTPALLEGRSFTSEAKGTLGLSIRGKVPVYNSKGQIVGVVSTGFLLKEVDEYAHIYGHWIILICAVLFIFALIGALIVSHRFKKAIFGMEPKEIAQLYEEKNRSDERFRSIMALSPDIISIISGDGTLIYNSPAALTLHGYTQEEMTGLNTLDLIHSDDQEHVRRAYNEVLNAPTLEASTVQYRYKNKDGSYIWMECSAINQLTNPLIKGVIAISRNIEDRKRTEGERLNLEQQLLHAQKLESLGILAGGIAHDFNNILMAIMGNTELALMRINPESPAVDNLKRIEQSTARAADLAKQMLAYSGKGQFVIKHLDMNLILQEMLHMLEVSISKKAELRLNLTPNLPAVEADATQIQQIIMNLLINASEAIGDMNGSITINTGFMECDKKYLKSFWQDKDIKGGMYVYLEITDTGCGMDKETLDKIFDPFFTTKFTGRGLGMAAVHGIVRGHKGAINVYSEPNKGTSFKVLLPAAGKLLEDKSIDTIQDGRHAEGTVLLVSGN